MNMDLPFRWKIVAVRAATIFIAIGNWLFLNAKTVQDKWDGL